MSSSSRFVILNGSTRPLSLWQKTSEESRLFPDRELLIRNKRDHGQRPDCDLNLELDPSGYRLILQVTPKQGFPTAETPPSPPAPPTACALCEPDRLLVLDGPLKDSFIDFIRNDDGEIGWARLGRIHRRIS